MKRTNKIFINNGIINIDGIGTMASIVDVQELEMTDKELGNEIETIEGFFMWKEAETEEFIRDLFKDMEVTENEIATMIVDAKGEYVCYKRKDIIMRQAI